MIEATADDEEAKEPKRSVSQTLSPH